MLGRGERDDRNANVSYRLFIELWWMYEYYPVPWYRS